MTSRFRGILFDFDGTLAKTLEHHFLAWEKTMAEYGVTIRETDYYPLEGMGLHQVAEIFTRGLSVSASQLDEIVQKKKKYYVRDQLLEFYPGVEGLISELKIKKIATAIVTAGHLDQLKQSVPSSFLNQFDVLITGDQLSKGKPNPEPYLKAAHTLGLNPNECLAVENAPLGVESARRANIYCIAICSTVRQELLCQANEILLSFADLKSSKTIHQLLNSSS